MWIQWSQAVGGPSRLVSCPPVSSPYRLYSKAVELSHMFEGFLFGKSELTYREFGAEQLLSVFDVTVYMVYAPEGLCV
eukprot:1010434-Pelagomonas_calceolata.AAC.1